MMADLHIKERESVQLMTVDWRAMCVWEQILCKVYTHEEKEGLCVGKLSEQYLKKGGKLLQMFILEVWKGNMEETFNHLREVAT